ncbi:MAG: YceI family protein [Bacteroidota bacterium]
MKRILSITGFICFLSLSLNAQVFVTKNGLVHIFSKTTMENVEAKNNQVNCAYDVKTTNLVFKVLVKSFVFERALMQEHFNENYMESDKFPSANFTGKVTNASDINFAKDGIYKATVEGNLVIHGVTKKVTEQGTFEVKGDKIMLKSKFAVVYADFNIKIPAAVAKSFTESIDVNVDLSMDKMK